MVNFRFDLQMFAALTIDLTTTLQYVPIVDGTPQSATNCGTGTYYLYDDGKYYASNSLTEVSSTSVALLGSVTTSNGSAVSFDLNVSNADSGTTLDVTGVAGTVVDTTGTKVITVTSGNAVTAKSLTVDASGNVTAMDSMDINATGDVIYLANASGTIAAKAGTATFSGVTAKLTDGTGVAVEDFTAGSITTSGAFTATSAAVGDLKTVEGVIVEGAASYTSVSDTSKDKGYYVLWLRWAPDRKSAWVWLMFLSA